MLGRVENLADFDLTPAAALDVSSLLEKTSRTFALAIPLLPEPTRGHVALAYLIFRIADTFEDADRWPRDRRIAALERLESLLASFDVAGARASAAEWLASPPCAQEGYLELLGKTPLVIEALARLEPLSREIVARHAARTARGMARVVGSGDERGNLRLASKQALAEYCYVVAGIVGELLTELFLHHERALSKERLALTSHARAFGEGLQLVNVLKDESADAGEGRTYLPSDLSRGELIAWAERDLDQAAAYIEALERGGAPRGYVAFTALSVALARASLGRLESGGAGSKVPRDEVMMLFGRLHAALDRGESVIPLLERVSRAAAK